MNSNDKLSLMLKNQLQNIQDNKKLSERDMKRIIKYTDNCIFGNECSLWNGYITNNKGKYINFYFNNSKTSLIRILYLNYIGNIYDNVYLTNTCQNKGLCCNINHIIIKKNKPKKEKNTVVFD